MSPTTPLQVKKVSLVTIPDGIQVKCLPISFIYQGHDESENVSAPSEQSDKSSNPPKPHLGMMAPALALEPFTPSLKHLKSVNIKPFGSISADHNPIVSKSDIPDGSDKTGDHAWGIAPIPELEKVKRDHVYVSSSKLPIKPLRISAPEPKVDEETPKKQPNAGKPRDHNPDGGGRVQTFEGKRGSKTHVNTEEAIKEEVKNATLHPDSAKVREKEKNDMVIEDRFLTQSYSSDIIYTAAILDSNHQSLFDGSSTRVVFNERHLCACIEVILAIQDPRLLEVAKVKSVLRFPAQAIESLRISAYYHEEYMNRTTGNQCFLVGIQYKRTHISSENVFVPNPHASMYRLISHLCNQNFIWLHVCGEDFIISNFDSLRKAIQHETLHDPLLSWIKADREGCTIQITELIAPTNRPEHTQYEQRYSFTTFGEWVITFSIGAFEEQEFAARNINAWHGYKMVWFCELLGANARAFLLLLPLPVDEHYRFTAGDFVIVSLPGSEDADTMIDLTASARVSEPIPGLPACVVPFILFRPYDKDLGKFVGFEGIKTIKLADQDTLLSNLDKLNKAPSSLVVMKIPIKEHHYGHQVIGLSSLVYYSQRVDPRAQNLIKLLIGNEIDQVVNYDIFKDIRDVVPDPLSTMRSLNAGQEAVVALACQAPAGIVNTHGPPGTGKTHVIGELARPFVIANQEACHILAVSASNPSTDALACRLQEIVLESGQPGQYVVRAHSVGTENNMVIRNANVASGVRQDAKPRVFKPLLSQDEQELFDSMHFARLVNKSYHRQNHHFLDLIKDGRVTEASHRLSLGTRILQAIGEIPSGPGDPAVNHDFAECRQLCRQYSSEIDFDDKQMKRLRASISQVQQHILYHAIAVATTSGLAVTSKIATPISQHTGILLVDEAARISEVDMIAIIGHYLCARGIVLCGDPNQLNPSVNDAKARFANQMALSLQTRLLGNGTPSVMLEEQHRMAPKISRPINNFAYQRRLIDHESTFLVKRPILAEIEAYMGEQYGVPRYAVLFNVQGSETSIASGTNSKYNPIMAQVCWNIATGILDRFPDISVAIICFYNAQFLVYLAMKDRAMIKNGDNAYCNLTIIKADMVQGLEFGVTVQDYTVGPKGAGFIIKPRISVVSTRAKYGSFPVIDKEHVKYARSRPLNRICAEYMDLGASVKVDESSPLRNSEFYDNKLVDFKNLFGSMAEFAETQINAVNQEIDAEGDDSLLQDWEGAGGVGGAGGPGGEESIAFQTSQEPMGIRDEGASRNGQESMGARRETLTWGVQGNATGSCQATSN